MTCGMFDYSRLPKHPDQFEYWCQVLFSAKLRCRDLKRYGRRGQNQRGIDLIGQDDEGKWVGIQCKLRNDDRALPCHVIEADLERSDELAPSIDAFIVATTAKRDAKVQDELRALVERRKGRDQRIEVFWWEDITDLFEEYPQIRDRLYGPQEAVPAAGSEPGRDSALVPQGMGCQIPRVADARTEDHPKGDHIDEEITRAFEPVLSGNPLKARAQLEFIQGNKWSEATEHQRYRILANLGHTYRVMEEYETAAKFYLNARAHEECKEARFLEGLGELYLEHDEKAAGIAEELIMADPDWEKGYFLRVLAVRGTKSVEEHLAEIPEKLHEDAEIAMALQFVALTQDDMVRAASLARVALTSSPDWNVPAINLAGMILQEEREKVMPASDVSGMHVDRSKVEEAERLLTAAIEATAEKVPLPLLATAYYNRAAARRLLGRDVEAEKDLEEATKRNPDDWAIAATSAVSLDFRGMTDAAIESLEKERGEKRPATAALLLALMLAERASEGDRHRALDRLRQGLDKLAEEDEATRVEFGILYGRLLTEEESAQSARSSVMEAADSLGEFATAIASAEIYSVSSNEGEAEEAARRAIDLLDADESRHVVYLLGRLLIRLQMFRDAVDVLHPRVMADRFDEVTNLLFAASWGVGEHAVIIEICSELRENGVRDKEALQWEIKTRRRYRDFVTAIQILRDWLGVHSDDVAGWVTLGGLAGQLGDADLLGEVRGRLPTVEKCPVELAPAVSQIIAAGPAGDAVAARRYAYRAVRARRGWKDAWMALIGSTFAPWIEKHEPYTPPTVVAVDTAVHLEVSEEPGPIVVVIESGDDPDPNWDEFAPGSTMVRAVMGKRVGESVELPGGLGASRSGKIIGIDKKEVFRAWQCLNDWVKRFPDSPFVQPVRVPEPRDESKEALLESLEGITSTLRAVEVRRLEARQQYQEGRIPLVTAARMASDPVIVTLDTVRGEPSDQIRCCSGAVAESQAADEALRGSGGVVLDASAVATLFRLGRTEILNRLPIRVVVPASAIEEIRGLRDRFTGEGEEGSSSLTLEDGELRVRRMTREEVAKERDHLDAAIAAFEQCEIESGIVLSTVDPEAREMMTRVFGSATTEAIAIARKERLTLWTDDLFISRYTSQQYGLGRVWTAWLYQWLESAGVVDSTEADECLIDLHVLRHAFTPLRASAILRSLELAKWEPNRFPARVILDRLGDSNVRAEGIVRVVTQFLELLWRRVLVQGSLDSIVQCCCTALDRRSDGREIGCAVHQVVELAFGLNVTGAMEAKRLLAAWLSTPRPLSAGGGLILPF